MNELLLQILSHVPVGLRGLFPELLLATSICLGLILDWSTSSQDKRLVVWFCALSVGAGIFLCQATGVPRGLVDLSGTFVADSLTLYIRLFSMTAAFLVLLALNGSRSLARRPELGEVALLVLAVALGAMLLASARHLIALYLGLEFLSLSSYGLAGFRAKDPRASEAGLKYVLYGAVASAVALFGMSHLWGMTGTFDIREIGVLLPQLPVPAVAISLAMVGSAFAYKLGLAPFHFWSPEVYQGCPTVPAGFLSTVPKAAGFTAILHLFPVLLPTGLPGLPVAKLSVAVVLLAVLSIVVGSGAAMVQKDAKRVLAFSSTANSGIMLLALSTWTTRQAIAALGFYLMAYLAANLGAFLALDLLCPDGDTRLERLAGAWRRRPRVVVALVLCTASLAGIPPLAGFVGKWAVLAEVVRTAVEDGFGMALVVGAMIALAGSVALAAAYLRLLRAAAVEEATEIEPPAALRAFLAEVPLFLCAAASLTLGGALPLLAVFHSRLSGG